jgi:Amt family ammonium transporter
VATHFAAASATLAWLAAEWMVSGKPSVLGGISGAVAGLVAITPASGFVKPFPALLIGLCAGVVCYAMVTVVKKRFGYDDALDAFGVHGAGGTLGALLTGIFATNAVNDSFKDSAGHLLPLGLVDGHGGQIGNQLRHRLGAGDCGDAGDSVDLRSHRRPAGERGRRDRRPRLQHARRGGVYLRAVA